MSLTNDKDRRDLSRDLKYYRVLRSLCREKNTGKSAFSEVGETPFELTFRSRRCELCDDWIGQIENTMPHLVKAVEQQRSQINKEGDVVRVDRAKHPTKESVRHLAGHAELLKPHPEDEDHLIPEEIYIIENSENYAVYENRFLYALFLYIKDFVSLRYREIAGISEGGSLELCSSMGVSDRDSELLWQSRMKDTRTGRSSDPTSPAGRLTGILGQLETLLSTDLMQEVAKAPLLRPPVVQTNVLRSNRHFAAAYELYSYLRAYDGAGYRVENREESRKELPQKDREMLGEIGELLRLVFADLASGRTSELEKIVQEEESRRKEEIRRELASGRANLSDGEYAELLESRLEELLFAYGDLEQRLAESERQCAEAKIRLEEAEVRAKEQSRRTDALEQDVRTAMKMGEKMLADEVIRSEKALLERDRLHERELSEKEEGWEQERALLVGQLRGCRLLAGEKEDGTDHTERERFLRLEREYFAFEKYYKSQWRLAKRKIRREELFKKGREKTKSEPPREDGGQ
ncbi:MAG: hypothetical protein ACI3XR_01120 [Eubacteriales bacterium]